MPRELVLVGGGHAHVEIIRRFALRPLPDTQLTVIDPNPFPVYSGMVPGFLAGQYERSELEIDLRALCKRAGAQFVEQAVVRVGDGSLEFADGRGLPYSLASLDIGSTVAGKDAPGVREFALPSRPIRTLVLEAEKLLHGNSASPIHIVGGGAGGVELAFCLEARIASSRATQPVSIVTSDASVLASSAAAVRRRVERALERRRIRVIPDTKVQEVRADSIRVGVDQYLPSSGAVWVTGPAAHPLATDSKLPTDSKGFVRIEPTLRVEGRPNLFAVGDCASLPGMKKAGVYAVRSGPLLDDNLRAVTSSRALERYEPQDDFLSLLNLGDGTAIASKWGVALEGRPMMWLKDRIDRSFMEKYR